MNRFEAYDIARKASDSVERMVRNTPTLLLGSEIARPAVIVKVHADGATEVEILAPHEIEMEAYTLNQRHEYAVSYTEIGVATGHLPHTADDIAYMLSTDHGISDDRINAGISRMSAYEYAVHCVGREAADEIEREALALAAEAYIHDGQLDRDLDRIIEDTADEITRHFIEPAAA